MNYEEKYKEALEKARKELNTCGSQDCDAARQIFRLFPELAESKDEKVRKALIDFFGKGAKYGGQTNGVYDKDILAWLEKQGGTSPVLSNSSNIGKDEQKPVEENKGNVGGISPNWSEEDEKMLDSVIGDILNADTFLGGKETASYKCDWLKSLQDRVQPKQEWTEEEIEPIISDYLCGREHYGGMIGRLCHLKPKQKQTEWGEDDKAFLDDILCKLEHDLILNKDEKDWIKSLRPQNRWKPSDKQMNNK